MEVWLLILEACEPTALCAFSRTCRLAYDWVSGSLLDCYWRKQLGYNYKSYICHGLCAYEKWLMVYLQECHEYGRLEIWSIRGMHYLAMVQDPSVKSCSFLRDQMCPFFDPMFNKYYGKKRNVQWTKVSRQYRVRVY